MSAMSSTMVTGYRCSVGKCDATLELKVAELLPLGSLDLRWHAPTTAEFYLRGWVWKLGHSEALTYCMKHVARALRCTCTRHNGYPLSVKRSCFHHGDQADVRLAPKPVDG